MAIVATTAMPYKSMGAGEAGTKLPGCWALEGSGGYWGGN